MATMGTVNLARGLMGCKQEDRNSRAEKCVLHPRLVLRCLVLVCLYV